MSKVTWTYGIRKISLVKILSTSMKTLQHEYVLFSKLNDIQESSNFLSLDTRNKKSTVKDVKNYIALRAPELAWLTFTKEGSVVTHYMGIDALYHKFKEYKHDNNKHDIKKT